MLLGLASGPGLFIKGHDVEFLPRLPQASGKMLFPPPSCACLSTDAPHTGCAPSRYTPEGLVVASESRKGPLGVSGPFASRDVGHIRILYKTLLWV